MELSTLRGAAAVTTSDSTVLATTSALYIGVAGDVTVDLEDRGTNVTFKAVPVGILWVAVNRVYATATTATNILALY